ncbi:MAG: 50S ribosomal protein L18 [Elusimicrobiales bacterium]|nr:50S ribosomal protein L18 [Elusimicrobiales bacterium]
MITKQRKYKFRKDRTRKRLFQNGLHLLRLQVHRSSKNIYAQIVDDVKGRTLVAASSLDKELKNKKLASGKNIATSRIVGELVAKRAVKAGIKKVCFDRGGRLYHGKIKALADSAREGGLQF